MRYITVAVRLVSLVFCCLHFAEGALITKDVSPQPISLSADSIKTWDENGYKVFYAQGTVRVEQGDIQINADSLVAWFSEVKVSQLAEGHMDVYCDSKVTLSQDGVTDDFEHMYLRLITTAGIVADSRNVAIESFEEGVNVGTYLRGKKIRDDGKGEFASRESPIGIPLGSPVSAPPEGLPVEIFADDIDSWVERDLRIIVATGNVRIERTGETLNADNVILYLDQKKEKDADPEQQTFEEFYAEGNVTLRRGKDILIADKVFENAKEGKGLLVNSTIRTTFSEVNIPMYIRGDEIKHRGQGQYDVKNGSFSSCTYGHPHFHFKSANIRLFKTDKHSIIATQKDTLYAGNIPIFYIPFLSFNLQKNRSLLKEWETGTASRFGRFVTTDWDLYSLASAGSLSDWSELTLSADYLSMRGPAVGLDFEYAKPNFWGLARTYYIQDKEDFDINSVPVEDNDRGHFLWRHRQLLRNGWRADIEVSQVSDRSYFREFHVMEFKTDKDRETLLYLRKISDNRGMTVRAERQLRTYDTYVDSTRLNRKNESLPEFKYRMIGEPLWEGRLNYTAETGLAYQSRMFDGISPKRAEERFLGRGALLTAERVFDRVPVRLEPEETIRFDTDHLLSAPFRFFGVRFNPFVGARLTGYSESVKRDPVTSENIGGGTPRLRIAGTLGIEANTTISRTYSTYNKFLNINRLRHIITPEMRFNFIPIVSQDPEDLNQFDGVDALDTYQSVSFGVRNRFQTKRGQTGSEIPVDIADFDIEFNLFPGNAGLNRKRDDYIKLDMRFNLSDKISILSEHNEFNLDRGGIDVFNLGVNYNNMPKWSFYLGNRFIENISSSVVVSSAVSLGEKWEVRFFELFDFKTRKTNVAGTLVSEESSNLNTSIVISRFFHDWIGSMTLAVDEVRTNNVARFDIVPRGGGTQNIRNMFMF
ncbi:MAG: LPS assembly protein LptD [Candidatus Scalindua sp.]|nr:LPS assembly protein LptD [Candidatus Scalindua sp.]